jgi:hypothetical protein
VPSNSQLRANWVGLGGSGGSGESVWCRVIHCKGITRMLFKTNLHLQIVPVQVQLEQPGHLYTPQ